MVRNILVCMLLAVSVLMEAFPAIAAGDDFWLVLGPYLRLHRTLEGGYAEFGVLLKYGNRLFR